MGACLSKKNPQSNPAAAEPKEEHPLETEPRGLHEDKEQTNSESDHEHSSTKSAKSDSKSSSTTKGSDSKPTAAAAAAPSNHQVDPAISPSLETKHPPPPHPHPRLLQTIHPTLTPIPGSPDETQPSPDELGKTPKTKMADHDKESETAETAPSQTKSEGLKKFMNILMPSKSKTSEGSNESKQSGSKSTRSDTKSTKSTRSSVDTKSKHDEHKRPPSSPKERKEHEAPNKEHEDPAEHEGHKGHEGHEGHKGHREEDPCKDFDPGKHHPDPCKDQGHTNGRRCESNRFKAAAKNSENEHEKKKPLDKSLFMRGRFDPVPGGSGLCSESKTGYAGRHNSPFTCPDLYTEKRGYDCDDGDDDWTPKAFRNDRCSPNITPTSERECKGYNPELTVVSGADRFRLTKGGSPQTGSHHHPSSHTNTGPSRDSMTPVNSTH